MAGNSYFAAADKASAFHKSIPQETQNLAASLPIQLHATMLGKPVKDVPRTRAPTTHMETQMKHLIPGLVPGIVAIWNSKPIDVIFSLFFFHSLYLCPSNKSFLMDWRHNNCDHYLLLSNRLPENQQIKTISMCCVTQFLRVRNPATALQRV